MKKIKSIILCTLMMFLSTSKNSNLVSALDSSESIAWNKKLSNGTTFNYWIDSNCEYTSSIPSAANGLMYPNGLYNPISMYQTNIKSNSIMDFYQISSCSGFWENTAGATSTFRKNSSGQYYQMSNIEKDCYDWIYAEITINDYYLCTSVFNSYFAPYGDNITGGNVNTFRKKIIIHEMCHALGCKDLKYEGNKDSIMYYIGTAGTGLSLTTDANQVLINKY